MATDTTNISTANNTISEHDVDQGHTTQSGAPVPVQVPAGQNVVRIQVTPGETVQLPFPSEGLAARLGDNGNLAVKVGDITVILLGYSDAVGQGDVTIIGNDGKQVDVADVLANTDPALDITTAAGPGAGDQAGGPDNNGGLFAVFDPAQGLGGLNAIGGLDPTALNYNLVQREFPELIEDDEVDTVPTLLNVRQGAVINEDDLAGRFEERSLKLAPDQDYQYQQQISGELADSLGIADAYTGGAQGNGNDPFDLNDNEEESQNGNDPANEDNGQGVDIDREPLTSTAVVTVDFHVDVPGKISFSNGGTSPLQTQLESMNLTSHGHELQYKILPATADDPNTVGVDESHGEVLVAYYVEPQLRWFQDPETEEWTQQEVDVATIVFTIGVREAEGTTGVSEFNIDFTIYGVLDNVPTINDVDGNISDIFDINVPFFMVDSDGSVTPSPVDAITFHDVDDVPSFGGIGWELVGGEGNTGGTWQQVIEPADTGIVHDETRGVQYHGSDENGDGDKGPSGEWEDDSDVDVSPLLAKVGWGGYEPVGAAQSYVAVSFGADGRALGNDEAGKTVFTEDGDANATAYQLYLGDANAPLTAGATNWTVMIDGVEVTVRAIQIDANTIIGIANKNDLNGDGEVDTAPQNELAANEVQSDAVASPDVPVFVLNIDPLNGQVTLVQLHQINHDNTSAADETSPSLVIYGDNPQVVAEDNFDSLANWTVLGNSDVSIVGDVGTSDAQPDPAHQALLIPFGGEEGDNTQDAADLESFFGLAAGSLSKIADDGFSSNGSEVATNGSAIKQTFDVTAGQILTVAFNFLDSENDGGEAGPSYQDFGFIVVGDQVFRLSNVGEADFASAANANNISWSEESGYLTFTFTFTQSGPVQIGFGVMNEGDQVVNPGLLIDELKITDGATQVNVRATDFDGDHVDTALSVQVQDDGPTVTYADLDTDTLTLDETRREGGDGIASVTADFADNFSSGGGFDYGTDGPGHASYALALEGSDVHSGLFAVDPMGAGGKGAEILLNKVGSDIVGAVGGVEYFRISVDADGKVTFSQTTNIWHSSTGNDDDSQTLNLSSADLLKIVQTLTDADGDSASGSINLGQGIFSIQDDGPVAIVNEDVSVSTLALDESVLPADGDGVRSVTADFAPNFNGSAPDFGTDGPGSVSYVLSISQAGIGSGLYALDNTDTTDGDSDGIGQGAQILLYNVNGVIHGRTSADGDDYFTISVDGNGKVTFAQQQNIWHGNTNSDDETQYLVTENIDDLKITQVIVDADGDSSSASINLGDDIFSIEDDGPDAVVNAEVAVPTLTVDETIRQGGDGIATTSADFAPNFVDGALDYGTDGPGSVSYSLELAGVGILTNLYAVDPTKPDGKGPEIELVDNNGEIRGQIGSTTYFTITVDSDGKVTFTQLLNIWHSDKSSGDDSETLHTDFSDALKITQTLTDADGDQSSVSISIGQGVFKIEDDGPVISDGASTAVLDETAGLQEDETLVLPANVSSLFASFGSAIGVAKGGAGGLAFDFGSDGAGSVHITNASGNDFLNTASGLHRVSDGAEVLFTTDPSDPTVLIGKVGNDVVIVVHVDTTDNTLWVAQYEPLQHANPDDNNDTASTGTLLHLTVIDADGDKVTSSLPLSVQIKDDGPSITDGGTTVTLDESDGNQAGTSDTSDVSALLNGLGSPLQVAHSNPGGVAFAYGTDGAGSVVLGNSLGQAFNGTPSGLFRTSDGAEILLYTDPNDPTLVKGMVGGELVLAVDLDTSNNTVWVATYQAIKHPDTNSNNESVSTLGLIHLTVTDRDGDHVTNPASIVIQIKDDGPTASLSTQPAVSITLDESIGLDPNDPNATSDDLANAGFFGKQTASVVGLFGTIDYDTDGKGTDPEYQLVLKGAGGTETALGTTNVATNLSVVDTANAYPNDSIVLVSVSAYQVNGYVGTYDPQHPEQSVLAFIVQIDKTTGLVTVEQALPIAHDVDGSSPAAHDDLASLIVSGDAGGGIFASLVATDGDGDKSIAVASTPIGIGFEDDGPKTSLSDQPAVSIRLDESIGSDVNDPNATSDEPASFGAIGTKSASTAGLFGAIDYGTDGKAAGALPVEYNLVLKGPGGAATTQGWSFIATNLSVADPANAYPNDSITLLAVSPYQITGYVGEYDAQHPVVAFIVYIHPGTGEVTVDQWLPIAHDTDGSSAASHDDLASLIVTGAAGGGIFVSQTATDGDGDTSTTVSSSPLGIGFEDDGPTLISASSNVAIDEDGLQNGNAGGTDDDAGTASANFAVNVDFGTDGKAAAAFALSDLVTGTVNGQPVALTSGAQPLHFGVLAQAENNYPAGTLVAYTGATLADHASWVFTATIDAQTGNGSFNLLKPLDHPIAGTEDNIVLSIGVRATDGDGDYVDATVTVNVDDDTPIARDDTDSVANFQSTTGNVITGVDTTNDPLGDDSKGADGASVTGVRQAPADGNSFDNDGSNGFTVTGKYGTLTMNAAGDYTYTRFGTGPLEAVDHFEYTLKDGDGDTSTAKLDITIADKDTSLDVPTTGEAGTKVFESGLPAGSGETADGIPNNDNSEKTSGTINFATPDGFGSLTIKGANAVAGADIVGSYGTLHIDSVNTATGVLTYTYTLTTNTAGDVTHDDFAVVVTDSDGDPKSLTLVVDIVDDVPTARDDLDSVTEGLGNQATGNVITGLDTTNPSAGADTKGADNAAVSGVTGPNGSDNDAAGGGFTVTGLYGTLTLQTNGSYVYTLTAASVPAGATETFTYTLTDGDGDSDPATLTIAIDQDTRIPTVTNSEVLVDEEGLPDGTLAPTNAGRGSSSFFVDTHGEGLSALTIGGAAVDLNAAYPQTLIDDSQGKLIVMAVIPSAGGFVVHYDFVLADNVLTHSAQGNTDTVNGPNFAVVATDATGDNNVAGSVQVVISDDAPIGKNDVDGTLNQLSTDGNVITGVGTMTGAAGADTPGADGASIVGIAAVGNPNPGTPVDASLVHGAGFSVQGVYGTLVIYADGYYVYTRTNGDPVHDGVDVFPYTLKDGDGDIVTPSLIMHIDDAGITVSVPPAGQAGALVDEKGLPSGSGEVVDPAPNTDQSEVTSGQITINAGDGLASITIGTKTLTLAQLQDSNTFPVTVTDAASHVGTLVLTGFAGNQISYTYTLNDNTSGDNTHDDFAIQVTDSDGDTGSTTLVVKIIDDVPHAVGENFGTFEHNLSPIYLGNVLANGDQFGADGAGSPKITNIGWSGWTTVSDGAGGWTMTSLIGSVNVAANGDATYTGNADYSVLNDVHISYTIQDGDGDVSHAQATFSLKSDPAEGTTSGTTAVDEDSKPNQYDSNTGNDSPVAKSIAITFTPVGDTVPNSVTIKDLPSGVVLTYKLGGVGADQTFTGDGSADLTISWAEAQTLKLTQPNNDSGTDYSISYSVNATDTSSGETANINGSIAVVVNAVADYPTALNAAFGGIGVQGQNVNLQINGSFGDVVDHSESHYLLVKLPDATWDGTGDSLTAVTLGAVNAYGVPAGTYIVVPVDSQLGVGDADATANVSIAVPVGAGGSSQSFPVYAVAVDSEFGEGPNDAGEITSDDVAVRESSADLSLVSKPSFSLNTAKLDEDGLGGSAGNQPGNGDDDQDAGDSGAGLVDPAGPRGTEAVWQQQVNINWGGNVGNLLIGIANQAGGFIQDSVGNYLRTADGARIQWAAENDNGTQKIYAYAEGSNSGTPVFTVVLTPGGQLTVDLLQPLQHGLANAENNLEFRLWVMASNSAGDTLDFLTINVDDDVPIAVADSNSVNEGALLTVDVANGVLKNDHAGADGYDAAGGVIGVRAAGVDTTSPVSTGVGSSITGLYGTLTLNADGSYSYKSNPNAISGNQTDVFVYSIKDKDGDIATTTLTINLNNGTVLAPDDNDALVHESALDKVKDGNDLVAGTVTGSLGEDSSLETDDSNQLNGSGGFGGLTYSLVGSATGTYGTIQINSDGTYTYTLTKNYDSQPDSDDGYNVEENKDSFTYLVTDANGNTATGTITVDIVDDVPVLTWRGSTEGAMHEGAPAPSNYLAIDEDWLTNGSQDAGSSPGDAQGDKWALNTYQVTGADGLANAVISGISFDGAVGDALRRSSDGAKIIFVTSADGKTVTGYADVDNSGSIETGEKTTANKVLEATVLPSGLLVDVRLDVYQALQNDSTPANVNSGDGNVESNINLHVTLQVTDGDGDKNSIVSNFQINDDMPIAVADSNSVNEGALLTVNAANGVLKNDTSGADGYDAAGGVVGVRAAGGDTTAPASGNVGTEINGLYGKLTLNADGSYTYKSNTDAISADAVDVFVYTIRDKDGDTSTTTLNINVANSSLLAPDDFDALVYENALDTSKDGQDLLASSITGSLGTSSSQETDSSNQVNATGGVGSYTYELVGSAVGLYGVIKINSDGTYTYTLTKNFDSTPDANDGANVEQDRDSFTYKVTDSNGNTATGKIYVDIVDDMPVITQTGTQTFNPTGANPQSGYLGLDEDWISVWGRQDAGSSSGDAKGGTTAIYTYSIGGADGLADAALTAIDVTGAMGSALSRYDGVPVIFVTSADGKTITGYADTDGSGSIDSGEMAVVANKVMQATATIVAGTPPQVQVKLEIFQALQHDSTVADKNSGDGNVESNINVHVTMTVTDGDGDKASVVSQFQVNDDMPLAVDDGVRTITSIGTDTNGTNLLSNDIAGADHVKTLTGIRLGDENGSFTAVGVGGTDIYIKADGTQGDSSNSIGKLHVNPDGSWTFNQSVSSDLPNLVFSYKMQDADGDTDTASFQVNLDSVPTITVTPATPATEAGYALVDEDRISGGNSDVPAQTGDDAGGASASGTWVVSGGDPAIAVTVFGITNGVTATGATAFDGTPILWFTSGSSLPAVLHGKTSSGGNDYFTLTINTDGTWQFDLLQPVKHSGTDSEDPNVLLNAVTLRAMDVDGDASLATIKIAIDDDMPVAVADSNSVNEGALLTVNAANGVLLNDKSGGDGYDAAGGVVGVRKADGDTTSPVATGVGGAIAGQYGTLTLNADGSYTYKSNPNAISGAASDVFVYTIKDKDGDTATTTLTINLNNGTVLAPADNDVLVYENALDLSKDGNDLVAGTVTGSLGSGSTGETDASNQLNGSGGFGALTYSLVGSATGTYGTIQINSNGTYTYTLSKNYDTSPDANNGANTEENKESFTYLVTDANGNTATGTITVDIVDDVPGITVSNPLPTLTVDETAFGTDATQNFASVFAEVAGADGKAGSTAYALGVNAGATGLVDTLSGNAVVLTLESGQVVGRAGAGGAIVFVVSVDASGNVKLDQQRAVVHPTTDPDEPKTLSAANLVTLTATITDGDGDKASATANIGQNLVFKDDGPSLAATGAIPTLTVDETVFGTDASTSFASIFVPTYGADGAGSVGSYTLGVNAGASGLVDTVTGNTVVLTLESGQVVGRAGAGGSIVFVVSVDASGNVTLDQQRAVMHTPNTGVDQSTSLSAANLVTLTATVTDKDGDTAQATANIGDKLVFKDDAPSATNDGTKVISALNGDATPELSFTVGTGLLANDSQGADTASISKITFNATDYTPSSGVITVNVTGGVLTVNTDGSWTFNQTALVPTATTHNFIYTLTDKDGDSTTATFAVTLKSQPVPLLNNATALVDEDGLPGGSLNDVTSPTNDPTPGDDVGGKNSTSEAVYSDTLPGLDWQGNVGTLTLSVNQTQLNTITLLDGTHPQLANVTGNGTSHLIVNNVGGQGVVDITINPTTGAYTVTLLSPVKHSSIGTEDNVTLDVTVTATNSGGTSTATLTVNIDDDLPTANSVGEVTSGSAVLNTNLMLVLDISGSMGWDSDLTGDGGSGALSKILVARAAVNELLEQYNSLGDVMVRIVTFSTNSAEQGSVWMTLTEAKTFVNALLDNDGSTNYDAALIAAMGAFADAGRLGDGTGGTILPSNDAPVQNVSYFISDGQPNQQTDFPGVDYGGGGNSSGIQSVEETAWINFLKQYDIKSYAIGVDPSFATEPTWQDALKPIAYDGAAESNDDPNLVITLSDFGALAQSLIGTIPTINASLLLNSNAFGGDGGYVKSLSFGNGTVLTYNPATNTITSSGVGVTYSWNSASHVLTVTLAEGVMAMNMATSVYVFTPNSSLGSVVTVPVGFVLADNDGETSGNTLTLGVSPVDYAPIARDDSLIAADSYGSGFAINDRWLLWNDSDRDGDTLSVVSPVTVNTNSAGTTSYTATGGGQSDTGAIAYSETSGTTLNGNGLDNILVGDGDNETLNGYEGKDVLVGGGGNDNLTGGEGNDLLMGGTGNDTYNFVGGNTGANATGQDLIVEEGGSADTVVLTGTTLAQVTLTQVGNNLKITYGSNADTITVEDQFSNPNKTIEFVTIGGVNYQVSGTSLLAMVAPNTNTASASGNEDAASIAVSLSGTDDGTVASFRITSIPGNGTLYKDAALTQVIAANDLVTATGNAATVYFKPNANYNGAPTFQYAAIDNLGLQDASPATATITVNAVNDAPVITGMGGTLAYTENAAATIIDSSGVTVSDIDSTNFNGGSLTVSFTVNGTAADQLAVNNQGTGNGQISVSGTTVSYNPNSGPTYVVGTLSGGTNGAPLVITFASNGVNPEAVQALIQNITYANNSDNPSTLPRTVTFSLNDGDGTANGGTNIGSATATINVTAVNDAPSTPTDANAIANSIAENAANGTAAGITANAIDPEGSTITYSLTNNAGGRFAIDASTGIVTVANGSLIDYETSTSHQITVQASDGANVSTQNFTINVTDVNTAVDVGNASTLSSGSFDGAHTDNGSSGNNTYNHSADSAGWHSLGNGGNDTLTGGSAADFLEGGAGNDTLTGNSGNDYLIGGGNNDTMSGGAGNDMLVFDNLDTSVNGGADKDWGRYDGGADTVDARAGGNMAGKLSGLDVLDFQTDTDAQTLKLDKTAVDAIADNNAGAHTLVIHGGSNDNLVLSDLANWTKASDDATSSGHTYDVYTQGTTTLYVDNDINVTAV